MQIHRHPNQIAIRAILFAMGLPMVIFMFMAIRTRQLQSIANPRWAQFAKVTGPKAVVIPEPRTSQRINVHTASIRSDQLSSRPTVASQTLDQSLSGSVTGYRSIETPVHFESASESLTDAHSGFKKATRNEAVSTPNSDASVEPRSVDNRTESTILQSTGRIESQLEDVRHRLDQISRRQLESQFELDQRGMQLLDAINAFRETIDGLATPDSSPPDEGPDDDVPLKKVTDELSVTSDQSVTESAIEIPKPTEKPPEAPTVNPPTLSSPHNSTTSDGSSIEPRQFTVDESNKNSNSGIAITPMATTSTSILTNDERARIQRELGRNDNDLYATTRSRTIEFRDEQGHLSRYDLAREYYVRATLHFERAEYATARRLVEASLRYNRDDIDAIRLRNELIQGMTHHAVR